MRYTYAYKTSDGTRHEAAMDAESREAVFVALREKGIKAIKVTAADGSKANGEVRGNTRVAAISVLGALCLVLSAAVVAVHLGRGGFVESALPIDFDSTVRRQIVGDAAVIEKGIRTAWEDVFEGEGERFLASFAIPGVPATLRSTSEAEVRKALGRRIAVAKGDSLEARQIKSIVEGMKGELRTFIAGGRHTVVEYGRRLVSRQEQEIGYYNRAKSEIEAAARRGIPERELLALWERRNDQLRQIGVRLVPLPEE